MKFGPNFGIISMFAILLLSLQAYAVDPTTSATAVSNNTTYVFGSWTASSIYVNLTCNPGASDCSTMAYCLDTANACNPSSGTVYNGTLNITNEGKSYLRYSSNSSNGTWGDISASLVQIDTTAPAISISDDASSSWTASDTIAVSASDSDSGVTDTRWIVRSDSACGASQDSDLNSGTSGTSMVAASDTTYQSKYICFRATNAVGIKNYAVSSQITHLDTTAPSVDIGSGRVTNVQFTQGAAVSDAASGISTYAWSKVSGLGTITFGSPSSRETSIRADTDGSYVIRLLVADGAGNTASDDVSLLWETTAPAISIGNPGNAAAKFKTLTATASKGQLYMAITNGSACDATLQFSNYLPVTFNNDTDNGKRICYKAVDDAGNTVYLLSDAVSGIHTALPVISLNGNSTVTLEVNTNYSDLGATAASKYDGDLTRNVTANSHVMKGSLGTYNVTYDVADAAGNKAVQVVRTIKVVDTTPPAITLNGNASVAIEVGGEYADAGATAADNYDANLTSKIVANISLDRTKAGVYNITYDVSDSSGNKAAQVVRTVKVTDNLGALLLMGFAAVVIVAIAAGAAYFAFMKKGRRGL